MAKDVFSVPVFLVVFRETLETVIIVSVLLAFLKQTLDGPNADRNVYKKLRAQVNTPITLFFTPHPSFIHHHHLLLLLVLVRSYFH
jgi:high-affinity Fe2+/Pb2+ permease